ncbi:hypothetical protein ACRJ4W_37285 [Streptomyces sp. GLT-R25]
MASQLLSDPGGDRITFSVRRADLLAAVGGAAVYTELTLVQHLAPAPAALLAALTLAAGLLRRP